jgi:hypothetical protein
LTFNGLRSLNLLNVTRLPRAFDWARENIDVWSLMLVEKCASPRCDREAVAEGSRRGEQLINCLFEDLPLPRPRPPYLWVGE